MVRFFLLQSFKEKVQRGLEIIIVLSGAAVLDHIHDHLKILFFRRGLMEQVQDQGGVQGDFGLLPKRVILLCPFWRGVFDKAVDQLHCVLIVPDVWERVKGVRMAWVDQVKYLDDIAFLNEQRRDGPQHLSFGIGDEKTAIGLHQIGLDEEAGLAGAGAADHDLEKIAPVLFPVQPHADILTEDGVFHRVFVPVLCVELSGAAPFCAAVLLTRPAVLF